MTDPLPTFHLMVLFAWLLPTVALAQDPPRAPSRGAIVTALEELEGAVVARCAIPGRTLSLAFGTKGKQLFLLDETLSLSRLNAKTLVIEKVAQVSGKPWRLVATKAGIAVLSREKSIQLLDSETLETIRQLDFPDASEVVGGPNDKRAWVVYSKGSRLALVDLAKGKQLAEVRADALGSPWKLQVSFGAPVLADGKLKTLYACSTDGRLFRLALKKRGVRITAAASQPQPIGIPSGASTVLDPQGKLLVVPTDFTSGMVDAERPVRGYRTDSLDKTVFTLKLPKPLMTNIQGWGPVPFYPRPVSFDSTGEQIYVACGDALLVYSRDGKQVASYTLSKRGHLNVVLPYPETKHLIVTGHYDFMRISLPGAKTFKNPPLR